MILTLAAASAADGRLSDPVRPTAQEVSVRLDPSGETYTGEVRIALAIDARTERFTLHADGLTLGPPTLRVRGKRVGVTTTVDGPRWTLVPERVLPPGTAELTIAFEGRYGADVGLYRWSDADATWLATQLEPDEARTAWPAFDEPRFKLPWTVRVEAPADQVVLSNMPVAERSVSGETQSVTFEPTPPISSYLVALAVGPFEATPLAEGRPGSVWTLPGRRAEAAELARVAPRHLAFLEDWFAEPCPYPKADFVALPHFTYGAMENPGLVLGAEAFLLVPDGDTAEHRGEVSFVAAHELAHYWFGDLVTLAWWDELWLNEAFADWMASKAERALHPELTQAALDVREARGSLAADTFDSARPLTTVVDPDHVFETVNLDQAYTKGGAVLDVVERWLGPETFRDGLRAYVDEHRHGVVTMADLIAASSAASGRDVASVVVPYVSQPGAPRLDFVRDGEGRWSVRVSRAVRSGDGGPGAWTVPLRLAFGRPDGTRGEVDLEVRGETPLPAVEGARWVFPATDGLGYLIWSQPEDANRALIADAPVALSGRERQALALDLDLLRSLGGMGLDAELDLFRALGADQPPEVVSAMLAPWEVFWLHRPEGRDEASAALLRSVLRPWLARVGTEPAPGESNEAPALRSRLLALLGRRGRDPEVLAWAADRSGRFLADPTALVDRATLPVALVLAASAGDDAFQAHLSEVREGVSDPTVSAALLAAYATVPTPSAREHALARLLDDPELQIGERLAMLEALFPEERADEHLAWAIANHDRFVAFVPPPYRAFTAAVAAGCDLDRYERGAAFFGSPERGLPGVEQVLAEGLASTRACVADRERYRPALAALLDAGAR